MKLRGLILVSAVAVALSGCAAPIIGAMTLGQVATIAGFASTLVTGKGLGDHALSLLTGKDCSFTEGLLRSDRDICEPRDSLATRDDFKGVFALFEDSRQNGEPGDEALTRYASARSQELAKGEAVEVTPASATSVDLRLLTFADNSNGTPRLETRYVYMMAPIPDQFAETGAVPMPLPETTEDAANVAVPIPESTLNLANIIVPVSKPGFVATPAAMIAPAPAVAPATPAPAAAPQQPDTITPSPLQQEADVSLPVKIYWYLSGR